MIAQRFVVPVLMVAALLAGCSKKDEDMAPPADTVSGTAMATPAAIPPATPPAASAAPVAASGDPIPLAKLASIFFPVPNGAPETGSWQDASAMDMDGRRMVNFIDKKDYWYSVQMVDCRSKDAKDAAAKPEAERGDLKWCYQAPTADKFKDYPIYKSDDVGKVVKAGKLIVIVSIAEPAHGKVKIADLDAFMGAMGLDEIAKL